MKKFLFTTLLLLTVVIGYSATPKLPSKCEVGLPEVLTKALIKESEAYNLMKSSDFGQNSKTARYWIAYSDRADNVTYETASSSAPKCGTLEFNETVRIAKIQNGFALVYNEPQKTVEYPSISKDAVCKGWIPMNKLLLWQSGLTNDKGILNKALLCINLDNVKEGSIGEVGTGYRTPAKNTKYSGRLEAGTKFYFIMKRENGMVLLANESKIDGTYTDKVLECWVADNSYVPWNQRSCLEPTWEYEDAEYFAAKNIQIDVYGSKNTSVKPAATFSAYNSVKVAEGPARLYAHRMKGNNLRYPVLDDNTDKLYNISTFGTQGENSNDVTDAKIEAEEMNKKILEKMSNINLAIVIDGTTSMEEYYPEVRDAIKQGCQYFDKNSNIKVGVVIYRDYSDGAALTEVLPLTPIRNIDRINTFLDNGGTYGIRSAKSDITEEEALYYGINHALDTLRFRKGESNMLLVVGDCGNDMNDNKVKREDIVKKLVDKQISIMGFQVQNKAKSAYDAFNTQMTSMIRESLTKVYQNLSASVKVSTKRIEDGYDFTSNSPDNYYFGRYLCANVSSGGGKMAPGKLSDLMSKQILTFSEVIKERMDVIVNSRPGGFRSNVDGQMGLNISDEFIKQQYGDDYDKYKALIEKSKQLVSFRGYARKEDESGRFYFKPVVFISESEFANMLKGLAPVHRVAITQQYKDRKSYVLALKALIKSIDGGVTEQELNGLTNAQITQIIGGLNEAPKSLKKGYTLEDLINEQVVSEAEYRGIVRDFKTKYETLNQIKSSKNYKYTRTEVNGTKYYWLPIEVLP